MLSPRERGGALRYLSRGFSDLNFVTLYYIVNQFNQITHETQHSHDMV